MMPIGNLVFDLWTLILTPAYLYTLTPQQVLSLSYISSEVSMKMIYPWIYQHINLVDQAAFTSFAKTFLKSPGIAECVSTVQISFNTMDLDKAFWASLSELLEALKNLYCLNMSYQHGDKDFALRFAQVAGSIPKACKQLHFKPVPDQSYLNVSKHGLRLPDRLLTLVHYTA